MRLLFLLGFCALISQWPKYITCWPTGGLNGYSAMDYGRINPLSGVLAFQQQQQQPIQLTSEEKKTAFSRLGKIKKLAATKQQQQEQATDNFEKHAEAVDLLPKVEQTPLEAVQKDVITQVNIPQTVQQQQQQTEVPLVSAAQQTVVPLAARQGQVEAPAQFFQQPQETIQSLISHDQAELEALKRKEEELYAKLDQHMFSNISPQQIAPAQLAQLINQEQAELVAVQNREQELIAKLDATTTAATAANVVPAQVTAVLNQDQAELAALKQRDRAILDELNFQALANGYQQLPGQQLQQQQLAATLKHDQAQIAAIEKKDQQLASLLNPATAHVPNYQQQQQQQVAPVFQQEVPAVPTQVTVQEQAPVPNVAALSVEEEATRNLNFKSLKGSKPSPSAFVSDKGLHDALNWEVTQADNVNSVDMATIQDEANKVLAERKLSEAKSEKTKSLSYGPGYSNQPSFANVYSAPNPTSQNYNNGQNIPDISSQNFNSLLIITNANDNQNLELVGLNPTDLKAFLSKYAKSMTIGHFLEHADIDHACEQYNYDTYGTSEEGTKTLSAKAEKAKLKNEVKSELKTNVPTFKGTGQEEKPTQNVKTDGESSHAESTVVLKTHRPYTPQNYEYSYTPVKQGGIVVINNNNENLNKKIRGILSGYGKPVNKHSGVLLPLPKVKIEHLMKDATIVNNNNVNHNY